MSGTLFLVATPIGNLEDITLRALRVLREADVVLAEDTRHSRTLLSHHGIQTKLESVHAHTSPTRIDALAEQLAQGAKFALITDAGSPLVSDPGAVLVEAAVARGVRVEAIPGPSAVVTALSVAGLPSGHFRFVGFLPRGGKRRREALTRIARDPLTSILFEAPRRLADTLKDLTQACGPDRRAAVCRELTKLHEEVARATLAELSTQFAEDARGEITLVVAGINEDEEAEAEALSDEDLDALIDAELARGLHTKEIAASLAAAHSLDPRELYKRVLARKSSSRS